MTDPQTPLRRQLTAKVRSKSARYKDWIWRTVFFVLIAGSLALSWWSLSQRLAPLEKRSAELSSSVARMSSEVDDLERKWSRAQAEETSRWAEQARDELFADQTALEAWLASVRLQAAPLGLLPKAEFDKPIETATRSEKLAIIPASLTLDFHSAPGGPEKPSAYSRLLRLTERLSAYSKRADLTEMKVESGIDSISHATLLFGLWATEGGTQ